MKFFFLILKVILTFSLAPKSIVGCGHRASGPNGAKQPDYTHTHSIQQTFITAYYVPGIFNKAVNKTQFLPSWSLRLGEDTK